MADLTSRPFHPNPEMACPACIFGERPGTEHAEWCKKRKEWEESTLRGLNSVYPCTCPTHTAIIRQGDRVICEFCGGLIYKERGSNAFRESL